MTDSKIEWTDKVWNPVVGCSVVSPGCDHCYAIPQSRRNAAMGRPEYVGLTRKIDGAGDEQRRGSEWTGVVRCLPERLNAPLLWRSPQRVFVNSMSDLFHPDVPDDFIADVFAVMALAPQHTFQILTKRPQRMAALLGQDPQRDDGWHAEREGGIEIRTPRDREAAFTWPLPNVWLGTSVENQRYADLRIPHLLVTPAAVRFLSIEPLLGPVDLVAAGAFHGFRDIPVSEVSGAALNDGAAACSSFTEPCPTIDWCIVGGESGPGARPMHPAWVREIRDSCVEAEVPFFFKQWGQYAPDTQGQVTVRTDGSVGDNDPPYLVDEVPMRRQSKRYTGRELDGRTWDEYPT